MGSFYIEQRETDPISTLEFHITNTDNRLMVPLLPADRHQKTPSTSTIRVDRSPLVSVIMPSYNTSQFIRQAIDSVLGQDYPSIELIIVDDGSTDNTVSIVRDLCLHDKRLKLHVQNNQGAAVARNQGISIARGEFVAFIDSDDFWLPGKISAQVRHLESNPDIDLVFSRWKTWKPDTQGAFQFPDIDECEVTESSTGSITERSGWLYNRLLLGSALHTITVMARRSLIERLGPFDQSLKRGQDYDYWLRASRETRIHQLNQIHALYRIHGQGCIKKWPAENYERIVVEKALSRWGLTGPDGTKTSTSVINQRLSKICLDFGYHHLVEGDPKIAFKQFIEALRFNPFNFSALKSLFRAAIKLPISSRKII